MSIRSRQRQAQRLGGSTVDLTEDGRLHIEGREFPLGELNDARMSCRWIPEEDADWFGHSCTHGPPPHDILVCITQKENSKRLYERLRAFAEGREQLKTEADRLSAWRG